MKIPQRLPPALRSQLYYGPPPPPPHNLIRIWGKNYWWILEHRVILPNSVKDSIFSSFFWRVPFKEEHLKIKKIRHLKTNINTNDPLDDSDFNMYI